MENSIRDLMRSIVRELGRAVIRDLFSFRRPRKTMRVSVLSEEETREHERLKRDNDFMFGGGPFFRPDEYGEEENER